MSKKTIQEILPLVQMPSRYLGYEINHIRKSWKNNQLHVALAFPDLYEIATSHFGIQILYGMLNQQENILAERVFAPASDMEGQLRNHNMQLCSLESKTPLKKFDIIGFSLLYELNYTNMVNMLDLSGIPFFTSQRDEKDPLIIAGGPCTCNPEPVADFFDAIVVGDGEAVILEMTDAWATWRRRDSRTKRGLLKRWSQIRGVYIPSFFNVTLDAHGNQRLIPKEIHHQRIRRAVVEDLNDAPISNKPIVPFGKPVHDRLRMEIARGCTRGCRFCQAGMIYRPVRERQPEVVLSSVARSLKETGYEDLSLLSLSTGDYSCIAPIIKNIMEFGEKGRVAVSLPSLRAGSLTPELMELVRKVRKTGFTIAPEAGSQRLRDVINKNITEADIVNTVDNAFSLGWKVIKLYFMIGLPTETHEDLEAIVALVKRLKQIKTQQGQGRSGKINVSVTTFVPKPHTPFQWEPQSSLETSINKINWLKEQLNLPGLHFKWQDPKVSMIEGVWARGDRRLNPVLVSAWKNGCRFDGWSDFFNFDRWMAVLENSEVAPQMFTRGRSDVERPLAWDHIDIGVDRSFLIEEKDRAKTGEITDDCRTGSCRGCGVCDFKTLSPVSFHEQKWVSSSKTPEHQRNAVGTGSKYIITFEKLGPARFFGHLEMITIFIRSLRRAEVPLKYSQGFHPMPKISFCDTLPMGLQSENEKMIVVLTEDVDAEELMRRLNRQLPEGFNITGCRIFTKHDFPSFSDIQNYRVQLKDGFFQQNDLDWFLEQPSVTIERKSKKGRRVTVDLKKVVSDIKLESSTIAAMTLGKDNNLMVRPSQILKTIFHLTEPQILTAIITKRKSV